ncbi:hypothetical protein [Microbaculum marinum]|uniref:Uncharacterized protein n=1 Tax=Microbaculum marinum TaxID=1764581 RepID=A0AAW9S1G3_9HYPH
MTRKFEPAIVLSTVNAPYRTPLNGEALAHCLKDPSLARSRPGHLSSFFGEVDASLQFEFAECYGIAASELIAAAREFANYSGESYPLAALAAD